MLSELFDAGVVAHDVLGVYLRGSVPQGTAVPFISDLDLSAYIFVGSELPCKQDTNLDATSEAADCDSSRTGHISGITNCKHPPGAGSASTAALASTDGVTRNVTIREKMSIVQVGKARSAQQGGGDQLQRVLGCVARGQKHLEAQFPFCSKIGKR